MFKLIASFRELSKNKTTLLGVSKHNLLEKFNLEFGRDFLTSLFEGIHLGTKVSTSFNFTLALFLNIQEDEITFLFQLITIFQTEITVIVSEGRDNQRTNVIQNEFNNIGNSIN